MFHSIILELTVVPMCERSPQGHHSDTGLHFLVGGRKREAPLEVGGLHRPAAGTHTKKLVYEGFLNYQLDYQKTKCVLRVVLVDDGLFKNQMEFLNPI